MASHEPSTGPGEDTHTHTHTDADTHTHTHIKTHINTHTHRLRAALRRDVGKNPAVLSMDFFDGQPF